MKKFFHLLQHHFLAPASSRPLAVLRLGVAAVLILQAAILSQQFFELFGNSGILQGPLKEFFSRANLPNIHRIIAPLVSNGYEEKTLLLATAMVYLCGLFLLLVGYKTRAAAFVVWLTHMLLISSHHTAYGLDTYAHIFLFYLIWIPSGEELSLDSYFSNSLPRKTWFARSSLRILQWHLCFAYLASALEKASGTQWWNGEAIWRSLMLPLYAQYDMNFLAQLPLLATFLGWATLVLEGGYIVFMWVPRVRNFWLISIISLHIGIMIFLGLHLFGLLMAWLNFALFGIDAENRSAVWSRVEFLRSFKRPQVTL